MICDIWTPTMIELQNIDDDILSYFETTINALPDATLIEGAKNSPELMQGLYQNKPNVKKIRERILNKVRLKKLQLPILEILRSATLSDSLIAVLSEKAIFYAPSTLYLQFGRIPILAAMLLDDRENIRDFAKFETITPNPISLKTNEIAFNVRFRRLLDALRPAFEGIPFQKLSVPPVQNQNEQKALTPLQIENQVKGSNIYKQIFRERNDFQIKFQQTLESKEKLNKELQTVSNAYVKLKLKLEAIEQDQQQRIAKGIAEGLTKRIAPWLTVTEKLIPLKTVSQSPIERATQLLEQQGKIDKRFGTRSTKKQELETLRHLQAELRDAQDESLRPLPQLTKEIQSLSNDIANLENVLNDSSIKPKSVLMQNLQQELSIIMDLAKLQEIKKAIEHKMTVQAWPIEQCQQTFDLIDRQATRIYDHNHCEISSLKDLPPPITPTQHFNHHLTHLKPCRILIDGYNLLFKLKKIIGHEFFNQNGAPNLKARELLIEQVRQLTNYYSLLKVEVIFDGPNDIQWSETDQLRVIFSGGSGKDRADGRIIEKLNFTAYNIESTVCFVVTEDRELLEKCKSLNAIVVSPIEMWSMLC
jgi:hypothetical protein